MFNSEEYGWNDLNVVMGGRPVIGLLGIKYKEAQEKKNIYAKGKKAIKRGRGNVTHEGEIKVLQSELRALMLDAGAGKSILSIKPFDIVVAYAPEAGGVISTDIIKYAEFTDVEIDINQGDANTEHTLPIIIGDVEWGV